MRDKGILELPLFLIAEHASPIRAWFPVETFHSLRQIALLLYALAISAGC